MKFDFDTFEFAGLIAPGSVIVLALLLLQPRLLKSGDAAVIIALAIIAAYVSGHLVAAVGNALEPFFDRLGVRGLESVGCVRWVEVGYLAPDQRDRLELLVRTNLYRDAPPGWSDSVEPDRLWQKTVAKQMYIAVVGSEKPQRVNTFDGLYSMSRGLAISFMFCVGAALFVSQYTAAIFCALGVALAIYRARKFKRLYSRELVQQFLLLEERQACREVSVARQG